MSKPNNQWVNMLPTFKPRVIGEGSRDKPGVRTGLGKFDCPGSLGQFQEGLSIFVNTWDYSPTLVEYAVALLPFGLVHFVVTGALRMYDFLPQKARNE